VLRLQQYAAAIAGNLPMICYRRKNEMRLDVESQAEIAFAELT
jgi:hypothetical protein